MISPKKTIYTLRVECDARIDAEELRQSLFRAHLVKALKAGSTDRSRRAWLESMRIGPVEEVRIPAVLFTSEERAQLMESVDLRDWAEARLVGDGLELDLARGEISELGDAEFIAEAVMQCVLEHDGESSWPEQLTSILRDAGIKEAARCCEVVEAVREHAAECGTCSLSDEDEEICQHECECDAAGLDECVCGKECECESKPGT